MAAENPMYMKNLIYTSPSDSVQNQSSSLAFLSAHVNICCVGVCCVLRSVSVCLNIWSQLATNYNFLKEYLSGFA
jgi:hypothetical protein